MPKKEKQMNGELGKRTYIHKYQHYCFECECHPDENPQELETDLRELHLD